MAGKGGGRKKNSPTGMADPSRAMYGFVLYLTSYILLGQLLNIDQLSNCKWLNCCMQCHTEWWIAAECCIQHRCIHSLGLSSRQLAAFHRVNVPTSKVKIALQNNLLLQCSLSQVLGSGCSCIPDGLCCPVYDCLHGTYSPHDSLSHWLLHDYW